MNNEPQTSGSAELLIDAAVQAAGRGSGLPSLLNGNRSILGGFINLALRVLRSVLPDRADRGLTEGRPKADRSAVRRLHRRFGLTAQDQSSTALGASRFGAQRARCLNRGRRRAATVSGFTRQRRSRRSTRRSRTRPRRGTVRDANGRCQRRGTRERPAPECRPGHYAANRNRRAGGKDSPPAPRPEFIGRATRDRCDRHFPPSRRARKTRVAAPRGRIPTLTVTRSREHQRVDPKNATSIHSLALPATRGLLADDILTVNSQMRPHCVRKRPRRCQPVRRP